MTRKRFPIASCFIFFPRELNSETGAVSRTNSAGGGVHCSSPEGVAVVETGIGGSVSREAEGVAKGVDEEADGVRRCALLSMYIMQIATKMVAPTATALARLKPTVAASFMSSVKPSPHLVRCESPSGFLSIVYNCRPNRLFLPTSVPKCASQLFPNQPDV